MDELKKAVYEANALAELIRQAHGRACRDANEMLALLLLDTIEPAQRIADRLAQIDTLVD